VTVGFRANSGPADNNLNATAQCQNQLERADLRRSNRIQNRDRNNGGLYGWGTGGHEGIGLGDGAVANHNWTPECRRGGQKAKKKKNAARGKKGQGGWEVADVPSSETDDLASEMVSNISQGVLSNLSNTSAQAWIESMKALVEGQPWGDENGAFVMNSLQSLVSRCKRSMQMVVGLEFVMMINMVQLAAKVDRYFYHYCHASPNLTGFLQPITSE
jgi:hypothetical protein